jgi:O-antigen/teichoic acid export membrane protein
MLRSILPRRKGGRILTLIAKNWKLIPTDLSKFFFASWGTGFSQIVSSLSLVWCSRLYDIEEFGKFSIWLTSLVLFSTMSTLRLELLIPTQYNHIESRRVAKICRSLSWKFGLVTLLLSITAYGLGMRFGPFDVATLILLGICVILYGIQSSYWQENVFLGEFNTNSVSKIMGTFFVVTAQLGIGFLVPSYYVLCLSTLLGSLASVLFLTLRSDKQSERKTEKKTLEIRKFLKQNHEFTKKILPGHFVTALVALIPVIVLTNVGGYEAAGFYLVCQTIFGSISNLVSNSLGEVFLNKVAIKKTDKKFVETTFLQSSRICLGIGASLLIVALGFAFILLDKVFAEKWNGLLPYFVCLAVWHSMRIAFTSLDRIVILKEKFSFEFGFHSVRAVVVIVTSIALVSWRVSPVYCVAVFTAVHTLFYSLMFLVTRLMARSKY